MITRWKTRNECDIAITENGGVCLYEGGQWLACHFNEVYEYRSKAYVDSLEQYDWIEPIAGEGQQELF